MIQDIYPKKYDDTFMILEPKDGDHIMFIKNNKFLARVKDEVLEIPRYDSSLKDYSYIYLFKIDEERFFFCKDEINEFSNFTYMSINLAHSSNLKWLTFGIITAFQFSSWYIKNRYCGCCGKETKLSQKERMIYCDCGNMIFPKISPVAIIGVINGDKICLTRRSPNAPFYALVSGFAEVGESIEETCRREVYEETGLHIKNIRYYKSQPWSLSDSLIMGFFADLDGSDKITLIDNELASAEWVSREDIPIRNNDFAITSEMIDAFAKGEVK